MSKPLFGRRGVLGRMTDKRRKDIAKSTLCAKCKNPLEISWGRDGHVDTVACVGCREVKYDRRDK